VPPTTPPRTSDAIQVSNVTGIAKAGNKVFKDQMVAIGASIISNITNATIRKTLFICYSN